MVNIENGWLVVKTIENGLVYVVRVEDNFKKEFK